MRTIVLTLLLLSFGSAASAQMQWWRFSYYVPSLGTLVISQAHPTKESCDRDRDWIGENGYEIRSDCQGSDR
ncbi:hypothetical protein ACQ4M3_19165 [Leptolyngbya sp. AN03gr2]|uniref:hypothetical protein n=1 Tax=Leptolyngbya sp. AN03gr2 TaxID=3423364 RepID=UPI003D31911B